MDHPRAKGSGDVVRCDVFYSMWRSRTVECPWGSGKPACETLLLHHEQVGWAGAHACVCPLQILEVLAGNALWLSRPPCVLVA